MQHVGSMFDRWTAACRVKRRPAERLKLGAKQSFDIWQLANFAMILGGRVKGWGPSIHIEDIKHFQLDLASF